MRFLPICFAITFAAACGDNNSAAVGPSQPDAPSSAQPDAPTTADAPATADAPVGLPDATAIPDAPGAPDASPPDAPAPDGIGVAIGTADGTGLSLPITAVTVTYLKPALGNLTDDPPGFTVQAEQNGPGLFVTVDPTTLGLDPALAVGDVVDFTITTMGTVGGERRAQAITSLTRSATGTDITPLVRDISSATDVVTNVAAYDSTIVTVTGTLTSDFANSGTGFQSAEIDTAGITGNASLTLRAPTTLISAIDMVKTCTVTATEIPVDRFNATVELGTYDVGDLQLSNCPAPVLVSAVATSATTAVVTFSRNIDPTSIDPTGSQFTADQGLSITAAAVAGRTVTLTTSTQTSSTAYTLTVANTVTDLQGSPLGTPFTVALSGFVTPAGVLINELNANVTGGCDQIELRVTSDGSMGNFVVTERTGVVASSELHFVFPAGFNVTKNSIVIVHLNAASTTCNPGGATQELTTPADQPQSTYAKNYDTAYDFYASDTGLTATDNVITVYDQTGTNIVDAVFLTTTNTGAADTLAQAGIVGAASQWIPSQSSYAVADFVAAAVLGLGSTSTSVTGTATSIQRKNDVDTNMASDWSTAPQTFGAINAGQSMLVARPTKHAVAPRRAPKK